MQTTMRFARIGLLAFLATAAGARAADRTQLANIPIYFEANQGQAEPLVRFLSRGPGYSFYLTSKQAVSVLADGSVVRMKWVGGNARSRVTGLSPLPGKSNYLVGKDARRWTTDIEQFARVRYEAVYPGIDLIFYGSGGRLEYDLIVEPGADVSQMRFAFEGIDKLRIDGDGSLLVGQMRQERPYSYQESNGKRQVVSSRFVLIGKRQVGFQVGAYDPGLPLVIDPSLGYSYKIAASGNDRPFGVAVDAAGNLYVTGWTNSPDFPIQGAFQGTYKGGFDAFVVKLNATGDAIVYATFLGGGAPDHGEAITVDGGGNATVFGRTDSTDFPVLNALQPTKKGTGSFNSDTFLTKLNAAGNGLIFSTYFGGSSPEIPSAIASDPAGNLYIAGKTESNDFTTTVGAFQRTFRFSGDGFVCKLTGNGQTLVFSSYLGGSGPDDVLAVVADSAGNAYLAGSTGSSNFPTVAPLQPALAGATDAFLARINASGSSLQFSTYLGGSGVDRGTGVAIDAAGNSYVAGSTESLNFPTRNPLQPANAGGGDAFVGKFNASGSALLYSTYLGGSGFEGGPSLVVNSSGSAFVFGTTGSSDFPLKDPLRETGAGRECFLSRINPAGSGLTFSTYYGSDGEDIAEGIAIAAASASASASLRWTSAGDTRPHKEEDEEPNNLWVIVTSYPAGSNTGSSDTNAGKVDTRTGPPPPPATKPPIGTNDATVKDPISMAGGEFYDESVDLRLRSLVPFSFERFYSSGLAAEAQLVSALGTNWMHNFELRLQTSGDSATVIFNRGHRVSFALKDGRWESANSHPWVFQLVQAGSLFRFYDPASHLIYVFNSDAGGRLERIQDQNGNALALSYSGSALSQVSDGLGRTLDFSYTDGRLARVADHSGRAVRFSYDGNNLVSAIDVRGGVTNYSYATAGPITLIASQTQPRGNKLFEQIFDASGRVAAQKDALGNTTTLSYDDPVPGRSAASNAAGGKSTYRHDSGRNLVEQTDERGNARQVTYDAFGRRRTIRDREGNTTTYSYHSPSGLVESIALANGARATFTYRERTLDGLRFHDLVRAVLPDGSVEQFEYDATGNVTARVDRSGQRWQFTRNSRGQLLTVAAPGGGTAIWTYNSDTTVASLQMPSSGTITFGYDDLKRLIRITRPDGAARSLSYDAADNLLSATDERGVSVGALFDANDRLSELVDAAGAKTTFAYTATDELANMVDPLGGKTEFAFDALDRIRAVTRADGSVLGFEYDPAGNPIVIKDGEGKSWLQSFDKDGRLVALTNPAGETIGLTRDTLGRVIEMASPTGKRVTFSYDAMSRVVAILDPQSNTGQFQYDPRGQLSAITLPGGIKTTLVRNSLGAITDIIDPNGKSWKYSYDGAGRVISVIDPLGNVQTYTRDSRGRITQAALPGGSSLSLTLDGSGQITKAAYSDGTVLNFTYDERGLLTTADGVTLRYDAKGNVTSSNGLLVERGSLDRVASVTYASGKRVTYLYDRRDRVVEIRDWLGGSTRFTYDDAARPLTITRPNGVTTTFGYDSDGSLASIREAGATQIASSVVTRDSVGRVQQTNRQAPLLPTAIQLSSVGLRNFNAASQSSAATYDGLGRRTSDGSRSYQWDLDSRLTKLTQAGDATELSYDAHGLLIQSKRAGATRQYIWNYALGRVSVSTMREENRDLQYYIHSPDGDLLYSIESVSGARRFYHYDETGNTLFLTNDSGAVSDSYSYAPYGKALGSNGNTDNPFTFGGRHGVLRLASDLYSIRKRVYDGATGEFLSRDLLTVLHPRVFNPYQYAGRDPVNFIDASGEDIEMPPPVQVVKAGTDVLRPVGLGFGFFGFRWFQQGTALVNLVEAIIEGIPSAEAVGHGRNLKEVNYAVSRLRQGQATVQQAKPYQTAGNVGAGLALVSAGITAAEHYQAGQQSRSEYRSASDQAIANSFARTDAIIQNYSDGKISCMELEKQMMQVRHQLEYEMMVLDNKAENDIMLNAAVAAHDSFAALLPVPIFIINWFEKQIFGYSPTGAR